MIVNGTGLEWTPSKNDLKLKAKCTRCGTVNLFDATAQQEATGLGIYIIDPGQQVTDPKPCKGCHKKNGIYATIGQVVNFVNEEMRSVHDADSVWIIRFKSILIESQATGQEGSHTVGKIYFDITNGTDARTAPTVIPGIAKDFECVIRHAAGPNKIFEDVGLEVEVPEGLKKLVSSSEFQEAFEEYYYQLLKDGSFVSAFVTGPKGAILNSKVTNSRFEQMAVYSIKKTNKKSKGAW